LQAAGKIDAHGTVRESSARGDFGAGHAFDETQDEWLAVGVGEGADGVESGAGLGGGVRVLGRDEFCSRGGLFSVGIFVDRHLGLGVAMKIGGTIAGDGGEPAREVVGIAEGREFRERLEEDVLNEVFDLVGWDAREQDAVDHASVARVEDAIRGAVAMLGSADEAYVGSRRIDLGIHGCDACVE